MECTFSTPVIYLLKLGLNYLAVEDHKVLIWILHSKRLINYIKKQFWDLLFVLLQLILLEYHFKPCI